jgi:hypothetical protein
MDKRVSQAGKVGRRIKVKNVIEYMNKEQSTRERQW